MTRLRWQTVLSAALFVAAGIEPASAGTIVLSNTFGASFDQSSGTRDVTVTGLEPGYDTGIITDVNIAITFSKIPDQGNPLFPDSPFYGEIRFALTGPAATTTILIGANAWSTGTGFFWDTITFDDAAAKVVNFQNAGPVAGTFRPVPGQALADFNGQLALGSWTLFIQDTQAEDPLIFFGYTLTIETAGTAAVPEPISLILVGTGLAVSLQRRRRSSSEDVDPGSVPTKRR